MSKKYSIAEARNNLAAIVHELEAIDSIELTRRGSPVAVLLSKEVYDRLQAGNTGFWHAYKNYAKQINLSELKIEPAEIFGGLRDHSAGRKVQL
jgi:prevent-host-death family protein